MSTEIKGPYPNPKVTIILPNPQFEDARASESKIQVKRTMTGRLITYVQSSDRVTLRLPFILSRMKSLELEAFINAYQSARWQVTLYDGSVWDAQLVGEPVIRAAVGRGGSSSTTGKEVVEVALTLSAKRL